MNMQHIVLRELYDLIHEVPNGHDLGERYKPLGRRFTRKEYARFTAVWGQEIARLEERLAAAKIDFVPWRAGS